MSARALLALCLALALGYYLGEPAVALAREYLHELALAVVVGLVLFAAWFVLHKTRKRNGAA